MHRLSVVAAPLVTVIVLTSSTAYAQLLPDTSSILPSTNIVNGVLTVNGLVAQPDEAATHEELPGLGHKFELLFSMIHDTDPEPFIFFGNTGNSGNSGGGAGVNEVISVTTTQAGAIGVAYRKLGNIPIDALTNQINLKYYFVNRSCGGGSPRITLAIDSDGDGDFDFNADGHVNPPLTMFCVSNKWRIEDLTDDLPRWTVTPGNAIPGFSFYPHTPWKEFAAVVKDAFPNHKVMAGLLVDDSCGFHPASCGKAYYDLVTIENRTLEIWQDAVRK